MDLIKKKFEKKKKKAADKRKNKLKTSKNGGKSGNNQKKKKKGKKKRASRHSSSSSDSSDSESNKERLKAVQSKLDQDAAAIDRKFRMAGALFKKPENPPAFPREILKSEWRDMTIDSKVTMDQLKTLDAYLKNRAELKSTDHVVIAEKLNKSIIDKLTDNVLRVDDEDKKATTRLKILTKFDEGRFAAIYIVQNEAAVDNDVVLVGNGRFMMKTALRLMSSHQITYRLSREINTLKSLWSKSNDPPLRIPPVLHEGRILGVPFYVTQIYDVNLEKCREEMGNGTFSPQSVFHIGQEIFTAIKFLHRRQIIHRDIKPTNVVLSFSNRDQWFLIDFGDAVTNGKNSSLSPPDGHTLTFLSREAHDLLNNSGPSSYQQDLESWWLIMVDMFKPLYWRGSNQVEQVQKEKRTFFSKLPSDLPAQLLEIGKLLKIDPSPYKEISRKMQEGLGNSKETGWIAEWYDRAATKKNGNRKLVKKGSGTEETTTFESDETVITNDKNDNKKDRSVYCSVMEPPPKASPVQPKITKKPSREAVAKPESPAQNINKMATFVDDSPIQTPKQDRSVYFTDFPVATAPAPVNDGKRKYRYKGKGK